MQSRAPIPHSSSSSMTTLRLFSSKKIRQYEFADDGGIGNDLRIRIGTDYVPVLDATNNGIGAAGLGSALVGDEMLFIRISPRGLIISHKPSINLGNGMPLNGQPERIVRNESFRPVCRRSKSEQCRVIEWDRVRAIDCIHPRTMILTLVATELHICPHYRYDDGPVTVAADRNHHRNHGPIKQFKFEFLLAEDLKAFITCGIHYGMIQRDDPSASATTGDQPTAGNKRRPAGCRSGRGTTVLGRFFHWLHHVFHH